MTAGDAGRVCGQPQAHPRGVQNSEPGDKTRSKTVLRVWPEATLLFQLTLLKLLVASTCRKGRGGVAQHALGRDRPAQWQLGTWPRHR